MRFLINLLPLWLVKKLYKALPPTACFRTTLGRVFRLIRIDDDFCIAISSEKYDAEVAKKLMDMKKQGEKLVDTAIAGLNTLSYENREDAIRRKAKLNGGKLDDNIDG
jgi:hypothetical protein